MILPEYVSYCLDALETAGFAAYCVGGCVRDAVLGRTFKKQSSFLFTPTTACAAAVR